MASYDNYPMFQLISQSIWCFSFMFAVVDFNFLITSRLSLPRGKQHFDVKLRRQKFPILKGMLRGCWSQAEPSPINSVWGYEDTAEVPYNGHQSDRKDTTCGNSTCNLCQLHQHFHCQGHQEYINYKIVFSSNLIVAYLKLVDPIWLIWNQSHLDSFYIIPCLCSLAVGVCR